MALQAKFKLQKELHFKVTSFLKQILNLANPLNLHVQFGHLIPCRNVIRKKFSFSYKKIDVKTAVGNYDFGSKNEIAIRK